MHKYLFEMSLNTGEKYYLSHPDEYIRALKSKINETIDDLQEDLNSIINFKNNVYKKFHQGCGCPNPNYTFIYIRRNLPSYVYHLELLIKFILIISNVEESKAKNFDDIFKEIDEYGNTKSNKLHSINKLTKKMDYFLSDELKSNNFLSENKKILLDLFTAWSYADSGRYSRLNFSHKKNSFKLQVSPQEYYLYGLYSKSVKFDIAPSNKNGNSLIFFEAILYQYHLNYFFDIFELNEKRIKKINLNKYHFENEYREMIDKQNVNMYDLALKFLNSFVEDFIELENYYISMLNDIWVSIIRDYNSKSFALKISENNFSKLFFVEENKKQI